MTHIDIFNGDADGLCALVQLHATAPRDSVLITGVKRDIELVARAEVAPGDRVTVLDVSLDKNRGALLDVLARGAEVLYVDHHFAGEIPAHSNLTAVIDTSADVCTSVLVDRYLGGACTAWAVVGAFGDNLGDVATRLAGSIGLGEAQVELARDLGTYLNYNGYGATVGDLHVPPEELFALLRPHPSPFDFVAAAPDVFARLAAGYRDDLGRADGVQPHAVSDATAAFILPDAPWARRVMGVFGNRLARAHPARAHAILTQSGDAFVVSVRAPLATRAGADALCRQFPTGGGRAAAAGINALPADQLDAFLAAFGAAFAPGGAR